MVETIRLEETGDYTHTSPHKNNVGTNFVVKDKGKVHTIRELANLFEGACPKMVHKCPKKKIHSRIRGNFEEQNKDLEPDMVINYCIIIIIIINSC